MPTPLFDGPEFLVNTTTTDSQEDPAITALPDGRFVVVWTDRSASGGDTFNGAVRAQIFDAEGTPWGTEFLVNTTTANNQTEPTVTALSDGRFVVAWRDASATGGDLSLSAIRAQIFDADGARAGSEFLVNTTTFNNQSEPTISALANGGFVVAWRDASATGADTSGSGVRAQVFGADGAPSGSEFLVNTITSNTQYEPTISTLSDGRFVVVWTDNSFSGGDISNTAIRGQIFGADGSPSGSEFLINTTTLGPQYSPSVAALAGGGFAVTWTDFSQTGGDTFSNAIRGQVFGANGAPVGSELLVNTTTNETQYEPSVRGLPDGRFVVTWTDLSESGLDISNYAIRGQVFNADGSPSGSEFLVNTNTANSQVESTITALPDGRFVVAWRDYSSMGGDTSITAIRAQIFDPRVGGIEVITGTDTQPRQLGSYDLVAVHRDALLSAQNASAVRSEDSFATHGSVIVDGSLWALSSGPVIDAIRLTGTSTGVSTGLGGHSVSIGAGGVVRSSHGNGVTVAGTGSQVTNLGEIHAGRRGVELQGGAELLVNQGTIAGGERSFIGSSSANEVRNSGTMIGNASMGAGDDVFDGRGGRLDGNWYGFDGNDRYDGRGASVITGGIYGGNDSDTLLGGDGDELQYGGSGNDRLSGLGGDDQLFGGNQNDTLYGGAGEDTALGGADADLVYGGAEADLVQGEDGNDTVYGGAGEDTALGGTGADLIYGGADSDEVIGDTGNDTLYGGAGEDSVLGGSNEDRLYGGAGDDTLDGGGSADVVYGGLGNDTLDGGTNNDTVSGGAGDDVLLGNSGNDWLYGGWGADTMTGGTGLDNFVFNTVPDGAYDTITDFNVADDGFRLDDAAFAGLATGALAGAAFAANATGTATTASHRILYETDTGRLYFDEDGTGSATRIQFAALDPGLALTAADFFVY